MWFETLTGFEERNPEQVRRHLSIEGDRMTSAANGRTMTHGRLETPTLQAQRTRAAEAALLGTLTLREVVADVQQLHADPEHAGAFFQVASQFNLLEMVSPSVVPEQGVGIYERDATQGPVCAIACGAGTIYRNYVVEVDGQPGQSSTRQLDMLAGLGHALGNTDKRLWTMRNGYALATAAGLDAITERLRQATDDERDALRQTLRIGLQWDTEVTLPGCGHRVTQAYCSALPVAYSDHAASRWEPFARLVLEAAYEATLCAAVVNAARTGNAAVFLTLLGGGAFGNREAWIFAALERALDLHAEAGLDVAVVNYGAFHRRVRALVEARAA